MVKHPRTVGRRALWDVECRTSSPENRLGTRVAMVPVFDLPQV